MPQTAGEGSIIIYPKSWLLVVYFFVGLVLLAVAAAIILPSFESHYPPKPAANFVRILLGGSLAGLALLVLHLVFSHLIHPRPILSITDEGIRGSGGLAGTKAFIAWHEVAGVRRRGRDIIIDLKNPADVMARSGWRRRLFMRITQSFYGTPTAFPILIGTMSPQAVAEWIENQRVQRVMK
jgi:hypothetical protein